MFSDVSYVDVYLNIITANSKYGIGCDESSAGGGDGSDYCNIYRNLITQAGSYNNIGMFNENSPNNNYYYNIVDAQDASAYNKGIWIRSHTGGNSNDCTVYNNVVDTPGATNCLQIGWSSDATTDILVRNNVFFTGAASVALVVDDAAARRTNEHSHVIDYNCYHQTSGNHVNWYNTFYATVAAFVSGTAGAGNNQVSGGHEANGLDTNPNMTDPTNGDFTLASNSPCINSGTDVSLTTDYVSAPVPNSAWVDMGAYEYALNATTVYLDATSGSDSNAGNTDSVPIQTMARLNAGDPEAWTTLYFKKGETWNEKLTVPTDGLTITSYGTGVRPIIAGQSTRDYCIDTNSKHALIIQNLALTGATTANLLLSSNDCTIRYLDVYSGDGIGVSVTGHDSTLYYNLVRGNTGDGVDVTGTGNVFYNLTVVDSGGHGFDIDQNCTIKNCMTGDDINIADGKNVTAGYNLFGDGGSVGPGAYSDADEQTHWNEDPKFNGIADFTLQETSYAVDGGTNVSLVLDFLAAVVPQGGAQDIGAYESAYTWVDPTPSVPGTTPANINLAANMGANLSANLGVKDIIIH
jgi:hypothetical protein